MTLIFSKDKLKLEDNKAQIVTNLTLGLFKNSDSRFDIEYPIVGKEASEEPEIEEPSKKKDKKNDKGDKKKQEEAAVKEEVPEEEEEDSVDRSEIDPAESISSKTKENDKNWLRSTLVQLVESDVNLFERDQVKEIFNHLVESYFENFELFKFSRSFKQLEEEIFIQVKNF